MKTLKKTLLNNLTLKLLAVVIAFFTWFVVMYNINPISQKTIRVPVRIINSEVLTGKNWEYDVVGDGYVEVEVSAKSFDLARVDAADFNLYVDMRYLTGSTNTEKRGTISTEIVNNTDIIKSYKVLSTYLEFKLEEVVTREYKINIITRGSAAENFIAAKEPTAVPDSIKVTGRSSQVDKISSVVYYLNIDDASEEINETGAPILLDSSGAVVEAGDDLKVTPEKVQIVLPIMQTKMVKVTCPEVSGVPATGYTVSDIEVDVQSIKIAGYKAILSNVSAIEIPADVISVEGIAQTKTYIVDLSTLALPEGITVVSSNPTVNVTVAVEKLKQNTYRISLTDDVSVEGKSDLYDYSFDTNIADIKVSGTSADLMAMEAANIQASVSVYGLDAGEYSLPLYITLPEDITLVNSVFVNVSVTPKETPEIPTPTPEEPTTTTEEETTTEEPSSEEPTPEDSSGESTAEEPSAPDETEPEESSLEPEDDAEPVETESAEDIGDPVESEADLTEEGNV
ncbi:MAG: hypothetical protein IKN24_06565 [Lachnospiraceae bacterium]|nr:hypothetical protein [Lachnospiraceae bacterium]